VTGGGGGPLLVCVFKRPWDRLAIHSFRPLFGL
jgi:hypothetical protein